MDIAAISDLSNLGGAEFVYEILRGIPTDPPLIQQRPNLSRNASKISYNLDYWLCRSIGCQFSHRIFPKPFHIRIKSAFYRFTNEAIVHQHR
jgi:hypothetical protein